MLFCTLTGLYPSWIAKSIPAMTLTHPFLRVNCSNFCSFKVSSEMFKESKPALCKAGSCRVNTNPFVVIARFCNPGICFNRTEKTTKEIALFISRLYSLKFHFLNVENQIYTITLKIWKVITNLIEQAFLFYFIYQQYRGNLFALLVRHQWV